MKIECQSLAPTAMMGGQNSTSLQNAIFHHMMDAELQGLAKDLSWYMAFLVPALMPGSWSYAWFLVFLVVFPRWLYKKYESSQKGVLEKKQKT